MGLVFLYENEMVRKILPIWLKGYTGSICMLDKPMIWSWNRHTLSSDKRHRKVLEFNLYLIAIIHGENSTIVSTFYIREVGGLRKFVGNLEVLVQFAAFINDPIFPLESFFSHELESQDGIFCWVIPKHISNQKTSTKLICWDVQTISCAALCLDRKDDASYIVDCYNIRESCARPAQPSCDPITSIKSLNQRMFVTITSISSDIGQPFLLSQPSL